MGQENNRLLSKVRGQAKRVRQLEVCTCCNSRGSANFAALLGSAVRFARPW